MKKKQRKVDLLFLDFDGTMVKNTPVIVDVNSDIFKIFGLKPITQAEYFAEFRGDPFELYRTRGVTVPNEVLSTYFQMLYGARLHEVELYPQVLETLLKLCTNGVYVGIISGQFRKFARPILENHNLDQFIVFEKYDVVDKATEIEKAIDYFHKNHLSVDPQKSGLCW